MARPRRQGQNIAARSLCADAGDSLPQSIRIGLSVHTSRAVEDEAQSNGKLMPCTIRRNTTTWCRRAAFSAEKQILGSKPAPRDLNMSARNIPSACRIANIALNDAMILPYDATPSRMEFSQRTSGGGAINAPAHRGSAGAAVHRQQKRRVDLHVVDTAADQLVEGFGA